MAHYCSNITLKQLCFTERPELARRLCSEHESKFHDLSGALGKGLLEKPLVVISTASRPTGVRCCVRKAQVGALNSASTGVNFDF